MTVRVLLRSNLFNGATKKTPRASPSSSWPRTSPFHGDDRGSNPLGDAKILSICAQLMLMKSPQGYDSGGFLWYFLHYKTSAQFIKLTKYMDCVAMLAMTFFIKSSQCEERSDETIHALLCRHQAHKSKKLAAAAVAANNNYYYNWNHV